MFKGCEIGEGTVLKQGRKHMLQGLKWSNKCIQAAIELIVCLIGLLDQYPEANMSWLFAGICGI